MKLVSKVIEINYENLAIVDVLDDIENYFE